MAVILARVSVLELLCERGVARLRSAGEICDRREVRRGYGRTVENALLTITIPPASEGARTTFAIGRARFSGAPDWP